MKQGADIEGAGGAAAAAAGYQGYPAGPAEPYYPQAAPPGRLTPRDPRKYSLCMGIVAWSLFVLVRAALR